VGHVFNECVPLYPGKCGVTLNSDWAWPKNESDVKDWAAAERRVQFHLGW